MDSNVLATSEQYPYVEPKLTVGKSIVSEVETDERGKTLVERDVNVDALKDRPKPR
jgi:hypothetical protein